MPDIRSVTVQLRRPSDGYPGQVTTGFYVVEGFRLTMTDESGQPVIDDLGQRFEVDVTGDDHARAVASALTPKVRRALLGMTETEEAFNRKLALPRMSVA